MEMLLFSAIYCVFSYYLTAFVNIFCRLLDPESLVVHFVVFTTLLNFVASFTFVGYILLKSLLRSLA